MEDKVVPLAITVLRQFANRLETKLENEWGKAFDVASGLSEYDVELIQLARNVADKLEERLLEE